MMMRKAAFAGQFYPSSGKKLRALISKYSPRVERKILVPGVLCPHAGYPFSGPVAAEVFAAVEVPPVALILNPSHNYYRPSFALWMGSSWETPLGETHIHKELSAELAALELVTEENRVHAPEHSGEVVLPFLKYHRPDIKIAVICVGAGAPEPAFRELGHGIAKCLEKAGAHDALVVASSDMSHEQGPGALDIVNKHDSLAIAHMEKLDPDGLVRECREKDITMCGVQPAAVMMHSVLARGGEKGNLIRRSTSAESPHGRDDYVVGYAGMVFN